MRKWPILTLASAIACAPKVQEPAGEDTGSGVAPPIAEACGYTPAPDLDPAEEVVEVDLTAAPAAWDPGTGTAIEGGYAYDGQVPGPVIEVERGQTLRVNLTNGLDHETTIHWHGLRVPADMDGVARPVAPGEVFTYEFEVVDAGFYWYHPHMSTDQDLERGLYGTIVARHPDEPRAGCEVPLVLDDVLLDGDGQIEPPGSDMEQVMGRLGNLLLANGRSDRRVEVTAGEPTVLRLVNASNARMLGLSIEGHAMRVLATDGGWLPEAVELEDLVLAPGERVVVAVDFEGAPGDEARLMNARVPLHGEDAHMSESDPLGDEPNPLMTFVIGEEAGMPMELTLPRDDAPALVDPGATAHQWVLDEDMMGGTVTVDGYSYPDVPTVTVPGSAPTAFEVRNDSEMRHPFHLHGNRFQVLSVDGIAPAYAGWKDTVDVPAGATVRFVSELDNPGEWLYHCHILEHAELGMAGFLAVEPSG
ncbi:MAG: multicopper oxidase family protein [Myxococcota bacterium]